MTVKLRAFVIALLALVFAGLTGTAASAAPSPNSGPTTGGTNVTINGIHFVQVAAGMRFAAGLTSTGQVFTWGENDFGQLGNGTTVGRSLPAPVLAPSGSGYLEGIVHLSVGLHSVVVSTETEVYGWGYNGSGNLGDGTTTNHSLPSLVPGISNVSALCLGDSHGVAITNSGVFAWGANTYGQLGTGNNTSSSVPLVIGGMPSGATDVACGDTYTLALANSNVYSWGENYFGELGIGSNVNQNSPQQIPALMGISLICAGPNFALASSVDHVYSWGANYRGELGIGTTTASNVPVQITGIGEALMLTASEEHAWALTRQGLYGWGWNNYGVLGNGSNSDQHAPVLIPGLNGGPTIHSPYGISTGPFASYISTDEGILVTGTGVFGLLGTGNTTSTNSLTLGPNFQPVSVQLGAGNTITPTVSGNSWSFVTPAGSPGPVNITATSAVFGGSVAASPATVSWNAGQYTYVDPPTLAATGETEPSLPLTLGGIMALLAGIVVLSFQRANRSLVE